MRFSEPKRRADGHNVSATGLPGPTTLGHITYHTILPAACPAHNPHCPGPVDVLQDQSDTCSLSLPPQWYEEGGRLTRIHFCLVYFLVPLVCLLHFFCFFFPFSSFFIYFFTYFLISYARLPAFLRPLLRALQTKTSSTTTTTVCRRVGCHQLNKHQYQMFFAYDAAFTGSGAAETVGERRERKARLRCEEASRSPFGLPTSGSAVAGSVFKYPSFGFSRKPSPHSTRSSAGISSAASAIRAPFLSEGPPRSSSSSLLSSTPPLSSTPFSPPSSWSVATTRAPPTPPYSLSERRSSPSPVATRLEPAVCEVGHSARASPVQASDSRPPSPPAANGYSVQSSSSPSTLGPDDGDLPAQRPQRLHARSQHRQPKSPQRYARCRVRWDEMSLELMVLVGSSCACGARRRQDERTGPACADTYGESSVLNPPPLAAGPTRIGDGGSDSNSSSTRGGCGQNPCVYGDDRAVVAAAAAERAFGKPVCGNAGGELYSKPLPPVPPPQCAASRAPPTPLTAATREAIRNRTAKSPFQLALSKMESSALKIMVRRLNEDWSECGDAEGLSAALLEQKIWSLVARQWLAGGGRPLQCPVHHVLLASEPRDGHRILNLYGSIGWSFAPPLPRAEGEREDMQADECSGWLGAGGKVPRLRCHHTHHPSPPRRGGGPAEPQQLAGAAQPPHCLHPRRQRPLPFPRQPL